MSICLIKVKGAARGHVTTISLYFELPLVFVWLESLVDVKLAALSTLMA